MDVRGLDWVGTRTSRFRESVDFFEQVLGLRVGTAEPDFVRLDLPDASCVEVFGPNDRDHLYFTTGPAVGFLVDDIEAARHELVRHHLELLGATAGTPGGARWQHFRAPDGYVYEVVEHPGKRGLVPTAAGTLGVLRLAWVGTRALRYEETREFFGGVMGLEVVEDLPELIEYRLPDGASVEIFLPGSPLDHPHFLTGPVPGFGVENVERAAGALRSLNVPILQSKMGPIGGWAHFRAPDGCVYELKQ
jgi:catechol 2,3-dioxygenase-like lactoylglutathione lyase family enzyme